ncbi:MAG TPA: hypothetical protein DCP36_18990, partial [Sporomusaceae bacterium]|nr:hypothetical protein [Sporomusaceae bacterium]
RVMASTNTDLKQLAKDKKFREDLYYRLNVLEINLPPLRDRIADLPLLIEALICRINSKIGADAKAITPASLDILKSYSWPGNVRELENLLEQAINWSEEAIIDVRKIPMKPWELEVASPARQAEQPFRNVVEQTERDLIISALQKTNGNKAMAARMLNIQRSVLYKKLERMNIAY